MPSDPAVHSHVRARREQSGVGAAELARRSGITRQALHAIETGAYVPNTLIALTLARALKCRVEDLFSLPPPQVQARPVGSLTPPARVRLARVQADWLAFASSGQGGLNDPADGVAQATLPDGLVSVHLLGDLERARRTLVLAGCDPSLALLCTHVARHAPQERVLLHSRSSLAALQALKGGQAHAAGIHLFDPLSQTSNLPFVERELPGQDVHLFTLWTWEQGLMVAPDNPLGVTGVCDLRRPGVRLVNREPGAGSRALLDAWLQAAGVSPDTVNGYDDPEFTPLGAAQRVASRLADAAPGPRSAAVALGLHFIPLQTERFDLAVPAGHLKHPGLQALLSVVGQPAFQTELRALGGYDPTQAGQLWTNTGGTP